MADYYGPQYDIQTGYPHQHYGITHLNNQIYAAAPPAGYDFRLEYFRGEGNGYIDLPKARIYDPAFNCTKGMMLMNSTLVIKDLKQVVYTDPVHDFEGGYDIEKCPTFDSELDCYIDDSYEIHAKGECCKVDKFEQRAVFSAHDQFYKGTCEADLICSEGGFAPPQAKPCDYGFVCDEETSLEKSTNYRCPDGFVCDFASTPDTKLHAPGSQLKRLCKEGSFCKTGDLGPSRSLCPRNYWCPTGTSDPLIGYLANDGLLRMLSQSHTAPPRNLHYQGGDRFTLLSDDDLECKAATLTSLHNRFHSKVQDHNNTNYLEYLAVQTKWPIATMEGTHFEERCARDSKSVFIQDAMRRKDCNCHTMFLTLASVYRFWLCTSDAPLENFGLGDAKVPPSGGKGRRDFWYPLSRIHKDFESALATDPSMEVFGLAFGEGNVCNFDDSDDSLTLTKGRLPNKEDLPKISPLPRHSSDYLEFDKNDGLAVRFMVAKTKVFESYVELKEHVKTEYGSEYEQAISGSRSGIDPYIYDLYNSIQLIEQFGRQLETFVYLNTTNETSATSINVLVGRGNNSHFKEFDFVGPLDWCDCQNLLRCPNATVSPAGSKNFGDCTSTKNEVLHRISLLPPTNNYTTLPSTEEGTVDESNTLKLNPLDVAILTVDQSMMTHNMTYGEHYQISIYDGCKPCPLRYQCKKANVKATDNSSACRYPSIDKQIDILNGCLKRHREKVCLYVDGSHKDVASCNSSNEDDLLFLEPDMDKCLSRPYFCADTSWNHLSFRRLCQDEQDDGRKSPVYDCSDVKKWEIYSQWKNKICCSQVPELRHINNTCENAVCVNNPLIEKIVREKLMGVFELEHGFKPPTEQPKGQLLMNASLQEEMDHENPLDLFNKYRNSEKIIPHNQYKPESSQTWTVTPNCCKCQRHMMPAFFATNYVRQEMVRAHVSGFPDDKHQTVQLTISALATVDLTVVVELLHGAYYFDFSEYFGEFDKTMLRVHSPSRFSESPEHASWLAVIEQSNFEKLDIDLPLNLPTRVAENGTKEMENRILVGRPSNITIGDPRVISTFKEETMYDNSSSSPATETAHSTSDSISTVLEENDWWNRYNTHDFLALPYIPFLSNCNGYDSHISLSRLLEEHPDCQAVDYDQTTPTKEHAINSKQPVSDTCLEVVLYCTYEEEIREARKNLRWFEAPPGSNLFQIVSNLYKNSFQASYKYPILNTPPFSFFIIS